MTDLTVILTATIAALPPTLAVIWSHRGTKTQLIEIHAITNDRLDKALARIITLELQISDLKNELKN